MLGLGLGEILFIAGVALVVVGPDRLPQVFRWLGRMYGKVRRASDELRRAFVLEADRQDAERRYEELKKRRDEALKKRREAQQQIGGVQAQADEPQQTPPVDPAADAEPREEPLGGSP